MPEAQFKRKDTLVKAVRRGVAAHLDEVIAVLTGPTKNRAAAARRELLRLEALLRLVRRPLGGEVFTRERRVVARALKVLGPAPPAARAVLKPLAKGRPTIDLDPVCAPLEAQADDDTAKPARRSKSPDPKVLRLLADLAEMRMRARYWHLPAGEFELLAPGVRSAYQRVKRLAGAEEPTAELAAAWGVLGRQLSTLEKMWPEAIEPYRKAVRSAERDARQAAALLAVRGHVQGHEDLRLRLDAQLETLNRRIQRQQARLLAETAVAFTKRLQAYWDAWRG